MLMLAVQIFLLPSVARASYACDVTTQWPQARVSSLAALQPEMRAKVVLLLDKLKLAEAEAGAGSVQHDFRVFETLRKISSECGLANPSVSKADPCKNPSRHAYGAALDVVPQGHWTGPWRSASWPGWDTLRAAAKAVGLRNDISWDRPHVEVARADITRWLQSDLGLNADGAWGLETEAAAKARAIELGVAWETPVPTSSPRINWQTYSNLRCAIRRKEEGGAPRSLADTLQPCTGRAGACIHVGRHHCGGGATVSGLCPGSNAIRCCPAPGTPLLRRFFAPCVTQAQLARMWSGAPSRATPSVVTDFNRAFQAFGITTPGRIRHFFAQITLESGQGRWVQEIWGPSAAQKRYEGRADLGNTQAGDGYLFRGGGYIQLTGRDNYQAFADYINDPRVMVEGAPYVGRLYPAVAAGFWWHRANMNDLVDREPTVQEVTRRVNGGTNGLAEREAYYQRALGVWTAGEFGDGTCDDKHRPHNATRSAPVPATTPVPTTPSATSTKAAARRTLAPSTTRATSTSTTSSTTTPWRVVSMPVGTPAATPAGAANATTPANSAPVSSSTSSSTSGSKSGSTSSSTNAAAAPTAAVPVGLQPDAAEVGSTSASEGAGSTDSALLAVLVAVLGLTLLSGLAVTCALSRRRNRLNRGDEENAAR